MRQEVASAVMRLRTATWPMYLHASTQWLLSNSCGIGLPDFRKGSRFTGARVIRGVDEVHDLRQLVVVRQVRTETAPLPDGN